MWEIFEKLIKEKGLTAYKVSQATGIGRSTFTDWKNGRSMPGTDKLIKIAEFLDVSVEYLKTGKEPEKKEKSPIPSYDKDTMEMIKLFSQLNKEQKNSILSMMRSFALTN